ncbi:type IV pili methyl-accepting chemotaxis transducer N-terminal domain-containing protein [Herbaspirillum sp.]|uniref:type IV pili methyl-accepting chemotaxis transducer N-terminal domain-containing protein n=1 Tax=Herbaspirillum sp. TaxID=1890675 RepID=UPI0031D2D7CA
MPAPAQPLLPLPPHKRLTFRILLMTLVGLGLTMTAIGYTLLLSWQLEGGGTVINEAGSLRMRAYELGLAMESGHERSDLQHHIERFGQILALVQSGQAGEPSFVPAAGPIHEQLLHVQDLWRQHMQVHARSVLEADEPALRRQALQHYLRELPDFVGEINLLVAYVEADLASKTTWLRLCQTALIFLALAASIAVLYLLYLWIVGPVRRLQAGIAGMSQNQPGVRVVVDSEDEFGQLAQAFNQMADHVQGVHRTLEERVAEKTARLREQNEEVGTLYEITDFLSGAHAIEALCDGFLKRIMQRMQADGGTVRILDERGNLYLTVHDGISDKIIDEERCLKIGDCLCGAATREGVILVRDFRELDTRQRYRCQEEGARSLGIFQILAREQAIGSFSLHFRQQRVIGGDERRLLETLGRHLGAAIENQRLIAREKEFAIAHERNLMAQGLHDSIAQGLNFLNLQVQMLEDSLARENLAEIREITPMLRTGVQENYEDVRELLLNFRSRLQDSNLESEMRKALAKLQRQTGLQGHITMSGDGPPLAPEQQLQVLFILQEALSNIRKHAQAGRVDIVVENGRDFCLTVRDDGHGFQPDQARAQGAEHVGLRIMQERAGRLGAQLDIDSRPGQGSCVTVRLPRQERLVA